MKHVVTKCLLTLCIGLSFAPLAGSGGVLVVASPHKKSTADLYSPRSSEMPRCNECSISKVKCHDKHEYCQQCDAKCKECPVDCEQCELTCVICLCEHKIEDEQALVCNHVFGEECIAGWEAQGDDKGCPSCRASIVYKARENCSLCDEHINPREPSIAYPCNYRDRGGLMLNDYWIPVPARVTETHVFHERCIKRLALLIAIKKNPYDPNEEPVFHCPVRHKHLCYHTTKDHKIPLSKVVPKQEYSKKIFPTGVMSSTSCEFCHYQVKPGENYTTYPCRWHNGTKNVEKQHLFHDTCLQPFAEKTAYKSDKDGSFVFFCPCDHGYVSDHEKFVVPLPTKFTAEYIFYRCAVCKKEVDESDPSNVIDTYDDYKLLSMTPIIEKIWYHSKCWGKHIAQSAKRRVAWSGEVYYTYTCPKHAGTSLSHTFEIPADKVVVEQ